MRPARRVAASFARSPTLRLASHRSQDEYVAPPEVVAAIEAGDAEQVKALLTPAPEGLSKSVLKKLVKQAEINKKKLDQGKAVVAPQAPEAAKPAPSPPPAAATPPVAAAGGGSADNESLVAALLAQIETLGLPADAMATLQQQRTALADAIAPHVNAMRNRHYVQGFNAHES